MRSPTWYLSQILRKDPGHFWETLHLLQRAEQKDAHTHMDTHKWQCLDYQHILRDLQRLPRNGRNELVSVTEASGNSFLFTVCKQKGYNLQFYKGSAVITQAFYYCFPEDAIKHCFESCFSTGFFFEIRGLLFSILHHIMCSALLFTLNLTFKLLVLHLHVFIVS